MRFIGVAGVIALAVFAAGCNTTLPVEIPGMPFPRTSDEEQIARVLEDVRTGMQSRRIFQVTAHVSRSYKDEEGRDYDAIVRYLNNIFENYRQIVITRVPPQIAVTGTSARVVETFGTTAEPRDPADYPPINLQGRVAVLLEKVGGEWLIISWASAD